MALSALRDLRIAESVVPTATDRFDVATLLPGHAAHVRVLNPAHDRSGRRVTWRSLIGSAVDPELQWEELQRRHPQSRALSEPDMGTIDPATAAELVRLLEPRTTTPDRCVFLVWEGYAGLNGTVAAAPTLTVGFQERVMHVLQGTLHDALESVEDDASGGRLPLWWLPLDGAWSVGNDLYGRSVYIGGDHATIGALLDSPLLEALPVPPDHPVGKEDL